VLAESLSVSKHAPFKHRAVAMPNPRPGALVRVSIGGISGGNRAIVRTDNVDKTIAYMEFAAVTLATIKGFQVVPHCFLPPA
jgi:hypothetical protein